MFVKSIKISKFRRFESLEIADLPPAKLVVLAGPNGSGKSSLFDAFSVWRQAHGTGLSWDDTYHQREGDPKGYSNQVDIKFHGVPEPKKSFYVRSAYRNDPSFKLSNLKRQANIEDEQRIRTMIESDAAVSLNYQRLASDALEDVFENEDESTTIGNFREKVVGDIRDSMLRLFPDLRLNSLGNPLTAGTFHFDKGSQKRFNYKNLSGGEKSAFDLILDLVVKKRAFNNTVFVIDEPEAHMNTRIQGVLLEELYNLVPEGSQLWVSTHSIGMMRRAREIHTRDPQNVIFLDFGGQDFDVPVTLEPVAPTRAFWQRVLDVALDDLALLVAPKQIVICEGNPISPVSGKNEEHDARCLDGIFSDEFPDTSFISAGSSREVSGDRLKFAAALPKIIKGINVRRVIDRDDHASSDAAIFKSEGVQVLRRRHLEAYLYDEEVLRALYEREGRIGDFPAAQAMRATAIAASVSRGNAPDDIKSAAGAIYTAIKKDLGLTACGNDQQAFARATLVPLIRPGMQVYQELKEDIFA